MTRYRNTLLLLAVVLMAGGLASAQVVTPAFQCTANAGVPPLVRAEGIAELVGDVVLNCSGGTATVAGAAVPQVNFRIFLNVNVTSWLLDGNWNESILSIDDPSPINQSPCPGNNCGLTGTGALTGVNYAVPTDPANLGQTVRNVFQGTWISPNQVEWLGVPVDPPGTTSTRIIRITNVRANANQLGVSGTLIPSSISMFISATGTTSVPINNPTQIVAYVQDGMSFSVVPGKENFLQCVSAAEAVALVANGNPLPNASRSCPGVGAQPDVYLKYKENFATAFKTRIGPAGTQRAFGQIYNTETGFHNPGLANAHGIGSAGLASQGTRLLARFNNVPAGVTLRVWSSAVWNCGDDADYDSTNDAWLVSADSAGAGGSITGTAEWKSITLSSGSGSATWEITPSTLAAPQGGANPFANDTIWFAVDVVYTANTTAGSPALGTATVNGTYAPLSSVVVASDTAPRPRFYDDSTATDLFSINSCATNLLWPYVTNQAGFETGLVVSNTSKDPFGTATQEGACTIYYYGFTTGGGAAPAPVTTPKVPAGQHAVWTLSSGGTVQTAGGTIAGAPGFQGYVIAHCLFQYAHGFAFISDIGATKLAMGYLALIMDAQMSEFPRTGSESEPLAH